MTTPTLPPFIRAACALDFRITSNLTGVFLVGPKVVPTKSDPLGQGPSQSEYFATLDEAIDGLPAFVRRVLGPVDDFDGSFNRQRSL